MTAIFARAGADSRRAGARRAHRRSAAGASPPSRPACRPSPATSVHAILLPGMPNLHSHAFQRGMAGLAETRGPGDDSFWSWREIDVPLRPVDDARRGRGGRGAALCRDAGGRLLPRRRVPLPAPRPRRPALCATSARWRSASRRPPPTTGIGLTLLPVFYAHSGFGGARRREGQRRFINDLDRFAPLLEASREAVDAHA